MHLTRRSAPRGRDDIKEAIFTNGLLSVLEYNNSIYFFVTLAEFWFDGHCFCIIPPQETQSLNCG